MHAPRRGVKDGYRTSLMLTKNNAVFLGRLSLSIQEKSGILIERSGIVRAVLDAVESSGIDLTGAESEEDLAAMLAQRLAGRAKPKKARKSARMG